MDFLQLRRSGYIISESEALNRKLWLRWEICNFYFPIGFFLLLLFCSRRRIIASIIEAYLLMDNFQRFSCRIRLQRQIISFSLARVEFYVPSWWEKKKNWNKSGIGCEFVWSIVTYESVGIYRFSERNETLILPLSPVPFTLNPISNVSAFMALSCWFFAHDFFSI